MPLQNIWPLRFNRGNDYDPEQIGEILKLIEQWGNGIPNAVEVVASVLPTTGLYAGRLVSVDSVKILYMYDGGWVPLKYFGPWTNTGNSIFQPGALGVAVNKSCYKLEGSLCTYAFHMTGTAPGAGGFALEVGLPFTVLAATGVVVTASDLIGQVLIYDPVAAVRHNVMAEVGAITNHCIFAADLGGGGAWAVAWAVNWQIRGWVQFRYR